MPVGDQLDHLVEVVARSAPRRAGARAPARTAHPRSRSSRRASRRRSAARARRAAARRHERVEAPAPHRRRAARRTRPARRAWSGTADPRGTPVRVVAGPAHALQERGDAVRRADLAHQLDRSHVDAKLERRGGHERAQLARPQPPLDPLAALPRERPVMGGHLILPEPLGPARGPPARTACGCSRTPAWCGAPPRGRRCCRGARRTGQRGAPPRARRPGARATGRAGAGARCRQRWGPARRAPTAGGPRSRPA